MRRFANRCSLGKWRQRHSATGRYWQFFRRPLKFAFRFASITITVANSEGNLKEAAVIETTHVAKNPQRECITLDRTRVGRKVTVEYLKGKEERAALRVLAKIVQHSEVFNAVLS